VPIYERADNPIGYYALITVKIAATISFGVMTLYLMGFIAAEPFLILGHAVQQQLTR
jgi:hypothetical protein